MAKTGRPSKFTVEVRQKILDSITAGATYDLAAQFAGVSYDTFNTWMKKAKRENSKDPEQAAYVAFANAVEQANAQMAVSALTAIQLSGEWQARAWILERRFPEQYGKQLTVDISIDTEIKKLKKIAKNLGVTLKDVLQTFVEEMESDGDGT